MVCERLGGGRITAIGRSATAIERTWARNDNHIAARRAVVQNVDLATFGGEERTFDNVFAVNVNGFWTSSAEGESAVLRRVLRPNGVVRLVYGGPAPGSARDVGPTVAATLERSGFAAEISHDPAATCGASRGALRGRADHLGVDLIDLAEQRVAVGGRVPVLVRRPGAR